jgi:hypothetical protein
VAVLHVFAFLYFLEKTWPTLLIEIVMAVPELSTSIDVYVSYLKNYSAHRQYIGL